MLLSRNEPIRAKELNELLQKQNWGIEPIEKLQKALDLSWGWICAKNEKWQSPND